HLSERFQWGQSWLRTGSERSRPPGEGEASERTTKGRIEITPSSRSPSLHVLPSPTVGPVGVRVGEGLVQGACQRGRKVTTRRRVMTKPVPESIHSSEL